MGSPRSAPNLTGGRQSRPNTTSREPPGGHSKPHKPEGSARVPQANNRCSPNCERSSAAENLSNSPPVCNGIVSSIQITIYRGGFAGSVVGALLFALSNMTNGPLRPRARTLAADGQVDRLRPRRLRVDAVPQQRSGTQACGRFRYKYETE